LSCGGAGLLGFGLGFGLLCAGGGGAPCRGGGGVRRASSINRQELHAASINAAQSNIEVKRFIVVII